MICSPSSLGAEAVRVVDPRREDGRAARSARTAAGAEARDGGRADRASLGPCRETEGTGAGEGARPAGSSTGRARAV